MAFPVMSREEQLAHLRSVSPEAAEAIDRADEARREIDESEGSEVAKADDLADAMLGAERVIRDADTALATQLVKNDEAVVGAIQGVKKRAEDRLRTLQAKALLRENPRAAAAWAELQTIGDAERTRRAVHGV